MTQTSLPPQKPTSSGSKLNRLLKRLTRKGDLVTLGPSEWKVTCPVHNDTGPSLAVTVASGRILLHCHAGCQTKAILEAIGLKWADLFDPELHGTAGSHPSRRKARHEVPKDLVAFRHEVYSALLERLTLSFDDLADLRRRGLNDMTIEGNGYRTLNPNAAAWAAKHLVERFGEEIYRLVPGFTNERSLKGDPRLMITRGLVVPVRNLQGQIIGVQVRVGDADAKYKWLSSSFCRSGAPCHVPVFRAPVSVIRVTEGPLKADIAQYLDRSVMCLGVAGVTQAFEALKVLNELSSVSEVRCCFDADIWDGKHEGAAELLRKFNTAVAEKWPVALELWDVNDAKGIDDLLVKGLKPRVIRGE